MENTSHSTQSSSKVGLLEEAVLQEMKLEITAARWQCIEAKKPSVSAFLFVIFLEEPENFLGVFLEDFEDRVRVKFSVKYSVEYRYVDLGATVKGVPQESNRQSFLDTFYFNQTVNDFLKYIQFSFL